eukprot:SM000008S22287  [mRNA]  locus=s8:865672:868188:- [translate_table: standard]
MVFTSSQGLLTALSHGERGYSYDYATLPLFIELLKIMICSVMLWREARGPRRPQITATWRQFCLFPALAAVYLVNNNLQFPAIHLLGPVTYQILSNLKILTTGVLFRIVLRKKLTMLQWMALVLLMVGTATSQLHGAGMEGAVFQAPVEGYALAVLMACLSAAAGVYAEYLMKSSNDSIYWQNLQLYSCGVVSNVLILTARDVAYRGGEPIWWQRLGAGFNAATWLVVLNAALTGLLVSWVIKYADNIVKVYATSTVMLLTTIISAALFEFSVTPQMYFTPAHILLSVQASADTSDAGGQSLTFVRVSKQSD